MFLESFPVGPFQCNCTILACEETRSAVVIDPGGEAERIIALLSQHDFTPLFLLHTHAHLDHVGATDALQKAAGGETCLHEDDMPLCTHLGIQAELFGLPEPATPTIDRYLKDSNTLYFGKQTIEVIHTPGHTPGSLCFFVSNAGLWTGDTLFSGSVGRTDLWGGSHPTLIDSIQKKLLTFPFETQVFPGHGRWTSIGLEKERNPYLQ